MTMNHPDNNSPSKQVEPELKECPFCGGPAEKRLTDGPKRGFIGCFNCMIGLPFNVPYGSAEVSVWNARISADNVSSAVNIPSGEWRQVHIKAGNPRVVAIEFETEEQATAFINSFAAAHP